MIGVAVPAEEETESQPAAELSADATTGDSPTTTEEAAPTTEEQPAETATEQTAPPPPPPPPPPPKPRVEQVIDGDTLDLDNGDRVRLIQIDAPEGKGECYGRRAGSVLRRLLPAGTPVRIVRDPNLDNIDQYGRLLRYVFKGARNLNIVLVRRGAASVWFFQGEQGRYAGDTLTAAGKRPGCEARRLGRLPGRARPDCRLYDASKAEPAARPGCANRQLRPAAPRCLHSTLRTGRRPRLTAETSMRATLLSALPTRTASTERETE